MLRVCLIVCAYVLDTIARLSLKKSLRHPRESDAFILPPDLFPSIRRSDDLMMPFQSTSRDIFVSVVVAVCCCCVDKLSFFHHIAFASRSDLMSNDVQVCTSFVYDSFAVSIVS